MRNLQEDIRQLSQEAVDIAKKLSIDLNYTNQSIEKIDQVLEKIIKQVKNNEKTNGKIADIFGAYVGNTLIKNLNQGEWVIEPTTKAVAIKIKDSYTFFPAKIYRRIKNGRDENISLLYQSTYNKYSNEPISLKVFSN